MEDVTHAPAGGPVPAVLYRLHDRPPWPQTVLIAFQHLLAMFVGTITPATIVAGALNLPFADRAYLINMSLVASGTGTLLQVISFRGFGSGLLSITGTSFAFITPIILAGKTGGLALVFGMSLTMAVVPLALAPFLPRLQRAFSPVVAGTVVLLIGLLLIPTSMFGIQTPLPGDHARAWDWWRPAVVLALVVVVPERLAAFLGAAVGGAAGALLAGTYACAWRSAGCARRQTGGAWFALPHPLKYGLSFDARFHPAVRLRLPRDGHRNARRPDRLFRTFRRTHQRAALLAAGARGRVCRRGELRARGVVEQLSQHDLCAEQRRDPDDRRGQPAGGLRLRRAAGGFRRFAGPGPLAGERAAARHGRADAGVVRFDRGGGHPHPDTRAALGQRECLIVAIALGLGLGVDLHPEALAPLPESLRLIFSSGISTGGLAALLLNVLLPARSAA